MSGWMLRSLLASSSTHRLLRRPVCVSLLGGRLELIREELERGPRLRRLFSAELDAPRGEVCPRLGGDLEGLARQALRGTKLLSVSPQCDLDPARSRTSRRTNDDPG
jgi:hypothetical protein